MKNRKQTSKKETKKNAKQRDLKPKKDAKGGVGENISFTYGSTQPTYKQQ